MTRWVWWCSLLTMGCGRSEAGFEALREQTGVYGVPNLDDDDGNGQRDYAQEGVEGEDDLAPLMLTDLAEGMRRNDTLEIALTGDASSLRVWSGDTVLLASGTREVSFEADSVPAELGVEFQTFLARSELTITQRAPDGEIIDEVALPLIASPLILNHHLQPAERSYVVAGEEGGTLRYYGQTISVDNFAMVVDMDAALGDSLSAPMMAEFQYDPWVQDEFETATVSSPTSRIDVVIDSIRDRGLDPYPERVVAGEDSVIRTWGGNAYPSSQDSFGNLEVSPPVTVDGVFYPFGRIYWGTWANNGGPAQPLRTTLRDNTVQAPFALDASFLCVGHVDEFVTFLPDPTAPKGFRMYVAHTGLGFEFLRDLDPASPLPRYGADHAYPTVGDMASDRGLEAFNEDVQRDGIDPAVEILRSELGLTDDDIVRVPSLFEEVPCGGPRAVALIPGTVNMLVVTGEAGASTLFAPDPFLRDPSAPQSSDPLIQYVNDLLPTSADVVWVDNWDVYHLAWGEVHCGTNTTRTPTAAWWTSALHLIDGDLP